MRRPLRIASVCTTLQIGGDENRLLAFARAVDRRRVEHTVVVLISPSDARDARSGPMLDRYREHDIDVIDLHETPRSEQPLTSRARSAARDIAAVGRVVAKLAHVFRERKIDVVDARMMYAILLGTWAGWLAGVPAIVATEYDLMYWYRGPWRLAINATLPFVDALVCDSHARLDEMQRGLRHPHPCGLVVPNGVFTPATTLSRDEARRRLGIPGDERIRLVAQVSRLVPCKGHRVLLAAARTVLAQAPDVHVLVCGYEQSASIGYREELETLAGALGIRDRVHFVAHPGPIGDVWAAVDVHAHASLHDSAPIAIHESMSLGLPAVVTAVGGVPEMVEHEVTGLVVPPGDPDAFAAALLRVLRDDELARRLGTAARARHEARYRPEVMAAALGDVFEVIVDGHRHIATGAVAPVRARTVA